MSCGAMGSFLLAQSIHDCSSIDLNIALRGTQYLPKEGIHQQLSLHRLGLRAGFSRDKFASRLFLAQIQTGGTQSYIGIDGESTVLRVEMADLRYQPWHFLQISTGIVEDLWIESETIDWKLRDLEKNLAEEYSWGTRGQIGASTLWIFPQNFGHVVFSYTTGEGAYRRERNNGKNTTGLLQFYPLQSTLLGISLYGQEGSYGFDSARNHRAGGRLSSEWSTGHGGVSAIKAWGLQADIVDEPLLWTIWGSQRLRKEISGIARAGQIRRETGTHLEVLTGISYSPQPETGLWLGWKNIRADRQTTGIAGTKASQNQQQIFIQINGRLEVL